MYYKNSIYANRGRALEEFIKFANERYKKKSVAFIEKQCTEFIPIRNSAGKVVNVKVEHKATFDFLGRYKQYPIAIEAKESRTDSIALSRIEPNQVDDLNAFCKSPGTIGLVVVSFESKRYYAIPWQFWAAAYELRALQKDRKTPKTVIFFNQEWNIPKRASVKETELLPEWKIPSQDLNFGLHYLKNAEKYITT